MAYSVLQSTPNKANCFLYDSTTESAILFGTSEEMFFWKSIIEMMEQDADNKEWAENLKSEKIKMLVDDGNTIEQAENFLRKTMPFLYKN